MNTAKIATALNTISVAFGELAEALNDSPEALPASAAGSGVAPARVDSPSPPSEPSPFEDETATWEAPDILDEGAESMCPKHKVLYTAGQFGPFCKQPTDDPAWGKQKGDRLWCKITPKNAAEYLRIKAAA